MMKKKFRRHFRIYFINSHPAYIVDEKGNEYFFHRTTHSKTSGGRNNWAKENPLNDGDERKMYIVKKEQHDKKGRFSLFECEIKRGVNISYPEIKKAGSTQTINVAQKFKPAKNIKPIKKRKNKTNKR